MAAWETRGSAPTSACARRRRAHAHAAAEAERERLENIFKAKPVANKQRFAGVSEQAKANMAQAHAAREEEEKRLDAAERAAQANAAKLTQTRVMTAAARAAEANAHYADAELAGELHLNELERGVADEIALLRADPHAYVAKLRVRREYYEGNVMTVPDPSGGPTLRIKTTDGVGAPPSSFAAAPPPPPP